LKIEIELHEAHADDGESVRIRIIREIRDPFGAAEATVTLVRDHDSGVELSADGEGEGYQDAVGRRYRLVRRLA
jgi:hypothetical protein